MIFGPHQLSDGTWLPEAPVGTGALKRSAAPDQGKPGAAVGGGAGARTFGGSGGAVFKGRGMRWVSGNGKINYRGD